MIYVTNVDAQLPRILRHSSQNNPAGAWLEPAYQCLMNDERDFGLAVVGRFNQKTLKSLSGETQPMNILGRKCQNEAEFILNLKPGKIWKRDEEILEFRCGS